MATIPKIVITLGENARLSNILINKYYFFFLISVEQQNGVLQNLIGNIHF